MALMMLGRWKGLQLSHDYQNPVPSRFKSLFTELIQTGGKT